MATNYDLKLVVDADTTEAQRKLDELSAAQSSPDVQEAAQRVRDTVAPSPERAQPAPRPQPPPLAPSPAPQTPAVHTLAAQDAADRVRRFRLDPNYRPNLSNNPDDFGNKAGEVAGKAIGKAVAGFIAHEVSATIFNGLKTPGGDNRQINQAEAGVSGALKYGTMGAMLGGPLGALLGGGLGAVMGVFQERQRQEKAVEARDNAMYWGEYRRTVSTAMSASDSAFGKSLELAGGWRQRQEMIRARRDEIESGSGSWSIQNLEKVLKDLDPESDRGRQVAANIEMQRNRVAALDQQLLDEGLGVAPGRLDPGSVADSWAKRGVQVGAQVDVAQVNEKIMGEVQNCRALLEKIANLTNDGTANIARMQRAVYD